VGIVDEKLRVLVTESGGLRAGLAGSRGRGRERGYRATFFKILTQGLG